MFRARKAARSLADRSMSLLPKSRKARRRLVVLAAVAPVLALAVGTSLYAMRDAVVFFYGPTEAASKHLPPGRTVRIGGLVQPGSVVKSAAGDIRFDITDGKNVVKASYRGELPDLFREGQGVVAQGAFAAGGGFQAQQVLAKHDERYMPKEVVDALKKSGEWQRNGGDVAYAPARSPVESAGG
jgi:cytochrome c-type biogenesis protein CcmE